MLLTPPGLLSRPKWSKKLRWRKFSRKDAKEGVRNATFQTLCGLAPLRETYLNLLYRTPKTLHPPRSDF